MWDSPQRTVGTIMLLRIKTSFLVEFNHTCPESHTHQQMAALQPLLTKIEERLSAEDDSFTKAIGMVSKKTGVPRVHVLLCSSSTPRHFSHCSSPGCYPLSDHSLAEWNGAAVYPRWFATCVSTLVVTASRFHLPDVPVLQGCRILQQG